MMRYLLVSVVFMMQCSASLGQVSVSVGPVLSLGYSKVLWVPKSAEFPGRDFIAHQGYQGSPAFGLRVDLRTSDSYRLGASVKYSFADHHHDVRGGGILPVTDLTYCVVDSDLELLRTIYNGIFAVVGFKHQVFTGIKELQVSVVPVDRNYANAGGLGYRVGVGYEWRNLGASLTYNHLYNYTGKWHIQYDANKVFDLQVYYLFRLGGKD